MLLDRDGSPWPARGYDFDFVFVLSESETRPTANVVDVTFRADSRGTVRACGFPIGVPVEIHLRHDGESTHVITLVLPPGGFLRTRLTRR